MLFYLIIKGLSATADGFGRESADRFTPVNHQIGFPSKSASNLGYIILGIVADNQFSN